MLNGLDIAWEVEELANRTRGFSSKSPGHTPGIANTLQTIHDNERR
jgi:hypothetical protein